MAKVEYIVSIGGGRGDDVWDREIKIEGEDLDIFTALAMAKEKLSYEEEVFAIINNDYIVTKQITK
jgi:hypothetical protein